MASPRQRARSVALQALYEADVSGHPACAAAKRLLEETRLSDTARELAAHLVKVVINNLPGIDEIIQGSAPLWPLAQVSPVDRNVLRLAVGELLFPPVDPAPLKAVINEAVDLAKQYGSEGSARFVNGVLGTVAGQLGNLRVAQEQRGNGAQDKGSGEPRDGAGGDAQEGEVVGSARSRLGRSPKTSRRR